MYREQIGPLRLWHWLLVLGVVALVLRLVVVFNVSMWIDDGATLESVRLPWGEMVAERFRMGHFPWFFLAFKAWHDVAGESLLALRLPSLVAALLALPVVASLALRISGARGALVAAAIFVVHGSLLRHAAELRFYSWMGLMGPLLLLLGLRHLEKPGWGRAALLGGVHLALLQTHLSAFLFTWPAFLALAVLGRARRAPRPWGVQLGAAFLLPVLLTIPVFWYLYRQVDMSEYEKFLAIPPWSDYFQALYEITVSMGERAKGWEFALGLGFPAICLYTVWRNRPPRPMESQPLRPLDVGTLFVVAAFAGPTAAFLLSRGGTGVFGQPRYYIAGAGGIIALAGGAAASIRWSRNWKVLLPALVFLAAAVVTGRKMLNRSEDVLTKHGMGLNIMADAIKADVPRGTLVLISDARQVPTIARYYLGETSYRYQPVSRELDEEAMRRLLAETIRPGEDVVLFLYKEDYGRVPALVREDFGPWASVSESDDDQPKWIYFRR